MEQLTEDIEFALAEILLDSVNRKCYNLSYHECAKMLSEILGRRVHYHGTLTKPLYQIGRLCNSLGLPLITAIVRLSNTTSVKQIGEGFYKMACELKPEYKQLSEIDTWKSELASVRSCTDWSALSDYLSQHRRVSETV